MKRLKSELSQIWYMGVTDYFLIQNEMNKHTIKIEHKIVTDLKSFIDDF